MMTRISRIMKADEETFNILEENTSIILELFKSSKIPKTSKALFMLIGKIMLIKNSILDLRESENIYSINILFRSLIEHHLRFMYVFMKSVETKDDSIGKVFLETLLLKEQHDIGKSYAKISKILGKESKVSWEDLSEIELNPKGLSMKYVDGKAKDFTYSKMIEYIDQRINKTKEFDSNFLLKIIPKYADLSSFVHGGPLSDKYVTEWSLKNKIADEIENQVCLAFMIFHAAVHLAFLIFYQHDKRFDKPYLQLGILMKALNEAINSVK